MIAFVDQHKDRFGVEPLCAQLPLCCSSYYEYKARQANPQLQPARWLRDEQLKPEIQRVFEENFCVYGAHKLWKQLNREGYAVARCTVARLMKDLGIRGVVRGKRWKTTIADESPSALGTTSIANSLQTSPTAYGSPTSPTSAPGAVSCSRLS